MGVGSEGPMHVDAAGPHSVACFVLCLSIVFSPFPHFLPDCVSSMQMQLIQYL